MNKRTFLKNASLLSIGSLSANPALGRWADAVAAYPEAVGGSDNDYWDNIRRGYRLKPDYINLENGYYCIMPQERYALCVIVAGRCRAFYFLNL